MNRTHIFRKPTRIVAAVIAAAVMGTLGGAADCAANQIGRLTSAGNGAMRSFYDYDALGRVTTETHLLDGQAFTYRHQYGYPQSGGGSAGPGSALVEKQLPDGERVSYRYDQTGGLGAINAGGEPVVGSIRRNARGQIIEARFGNGVLSIRRYNEAGDLRLALIRTCTGAEAQSAEVCLAGRNPAQSYRYAYDENGNLTEVIDEVAAGSFSAAYDYDAMDQLIWRLDEAGIENRYQYDAAGNLIEKEGRVQTYGGEGRGPHALASSGGVGYRYDANGNLVSSTDGLAIAWNPENMAVRVEKGTAAYRKHYVGESLWKKAEGDTTTYYLPSVRVENGRLRKYYEGFAERSAEDGKLRFYHPDHLGSATLMTDPEGTAIHRSAFLPYGQEIAGSGGPFTPKKRFNSKEKESSGLYDYGARLYDPVTGRFISADTHLDGLNRYAYTGNNPLKYTDPTGHDRQPAMYAPNSAYAQWREEMIKRFGPEAGQAVIDGVAAIDQAAKRNESVLFLAQGIKNPSAANEANRLAWQEALKVRTVAMVNDNGARDAANARSNSVSAEALAYLINYAMGAKNMKGSDILLGTHSNGANVLNETLKILKDRYGRTVADTKVRIMAPNTSVSTVYSISRQVGNSQVLVYDSVRDTALLGAGMSGKGVGFINYNHISRSTRPANVHFYVVNTAWTAPPSPANNWEGVFNHNVVHYFGAISKGNYWEYKP
jgi:RHS repeat-associated protein